MFDANKVVILDLGSRMAKVGFSKENAPRCVFHSVVGYKKYLSFEIKKREIIIGDEAYDKFGILIRNYPIEKGIVKNWAIYEELLNYSFNEVLHIDPMEFPVLMTEKTMNTKCNREKLAQLMFETFNVPSLFIGNQSVLSLYSYGKRTGIVFNSGYEESYTVPIYEGYSIQHCINKIELGGRDLTLWLTKMMNERGIEVEYESEIESVNDIKKNICYISLDYENEMLKDPSNYQYEYKFPNNYSLSFSNERFRCPELLFQPSLNNFKFEGIDKTLFDSIVKCDTDIHKYLYSNIVLSGGNSLFNGFAERMKKEISSLSKLEKNINIFADPKKKYASWIGGSILAESNEFNQMTVNQNEYKDVGINIINKKFIL